MRKLIFAFIFSLVPCIAFAQIQKAELTSYWEDIREVLTDEDNSYLKAGANATLFLGRLRLQNKIGVPLLEARYSVTEQERPDVVDWRGAFFLPALLKQLKLKGIATSERVGTKLPKNMAYMP